MSPTNIAERSRSISSSTTALEATAAIPLVKYSTEPERQPLVIVSLPLLLLLLFSNIFAFSPPQLLASYKTLTSLTSPLLFVGLFAWRHSYKGVVQNVALPLSSSLIFQFHQCYHRIALHLNLSARQFIAVSSSITDAIIIDGTASIERMALQF